MPSLSLFDALPRILRLRGMPFDLKSYPYLKRIYNSSARRVCLFTGRQVSKSTTLASLLVGRAVLAPRSVSLFVAPLMDQVDVFSLQRLREFIHDSPLVKAGYFTGGNVVDQVYRKAFSNGSMITMGYAQRTADRLRGRSIVAGVGPNAESILCFDEIQDIIGDVMPVIEEVAFRAPGSKYLYCGTPKSLENHMETFRARSTGSEWAVRCLATGCKKWNLDWTEKNIGNHGVICQHCGAPLDTDPGQWVSARTLDTEKGKDSRVPYESYRIPQLIVKPIMSNPEGWVTLIGKQNKYSKEKFQNEVLGLPADSSAKPVTRSQLAACCISDRPNVLPLPGTHKLRQLVMGFDWAINGGVNEGNSFSAAIIGAWNPFPSKFEVLYWKIFSGAEAGPEYEIDWAIRTANACRIDLVAADWGQGQVANIQLSNALGAERVCQVWHAGNMGSGAGSKAPRVKWEPKTGKYHLARTRVLTDTFESLRNKQVAFPRVEDCDAMFEQILSSGLEYNDKSNVMRYVNSRPDDCLHALTYAMIGSELMINGDFRGHMGSMPAQEGNPHDDAWDMSADAETDSLYT